MRLVAREKIAPMICSTSGTHTSSHQSPHQSSSSPSRYQKPPSLDIMRLSKRFQPQPQTQRVNDEEQEQKRTKRSDYTQNISLLEFTPEKQEIQANEAGCEDISEKELKISFFNEGQECSASGVPISVGKASASPLTNLSQSITAFQNQEQHSERVLKIYKDRWSSADIQESKRFTHQDSHLFAKNKSTLIQTPIEHSYSLSSPPSSSSQSMPLLIGKVVF